MSIYDFQNNSSTRDPILLGVTGDMCATCKATEIPLYDLSCHDSDDFHCRDCLTKTWNDGQDGVVCCPSCDQNCGFVALKPLQDFHIGRHFQDDEAFDKIRQQPEIMNNLIGFTATEAIEFLKHAYSLVEDQILDPTELGGLAGQHTHPDNSLALSLETNPFYFYIAKEISQVSKMMTTPLELEEDVLNLLDRIMLDCMKNKYGSQLTVSGVDLNDDAWVVEEISRRFSDPYFEKVKENWIAIVKMWIDLLTWRHIERTAPVDGGAAERLRKPAVLCP